MKNLTQSSADYSRIEKAIGFLEKNFQRQPNLAEIAAASGVSEYHFQRIFLRWAGVSPKRFLQFLTKEHAKQLLKSSNLLDSSFAAGLSGPGRLHDLFVTCEAMSPGEYKQKGRGLKISYGFHPTPFGECFIALTDRGICGLSFINRIDRSNVLKDFQKFWKNAIFHHDQTITGQRVERIFSKKGKVRLLCGGTNFQLKVWEALLKIPPGKVVTYQTIAQKIGKPGASRAVGNAVGRNTIAYLIPCHRVIRGAANIGGYRWGARRKKAMLGREAVLK